MKPHRLSLLAALAVLCAAAVIRFGRELLNDRKMSSATFAKAKELYGAKGGMDLVAVMSSYAVSGSTPLP